MIKSFKSKRLKRLHQQDDVSQLRPDMALKAKIILRMLDVAVTIEEMDRKGWGLHRLSGDLKGFWSVGISRNWRIIFRFVDGHAYDVDMIDYH